MNRKKLSKKTKNIIVEFIIFILLLMIISLSFLSDISLLNVPSFTILNFSNIEDLFISLFTIQASIATVSIAIVSIITGLVNEYVLGISISGFITNKKPFIFKHNRLIIANLFVSVLNYICISFSFFNVCIALFIVSITITILLLNKVYIVFLGKNKIKKDIYNYVLENYDSAILNDLNNELISAIEISSSLTIKEDFDIIKKIFQIEATKSNYNSTDIIEQLSNIVCDAFEKTTYKHNEQKTNDFLLFICEIYEIANKNEEHPLKLNIWNNIVRAFFRALKDLDFEQLRDDFVYSRLHIQLYKNLKGRTAQEIKESNLKYYSSRVYSILFVENNKLKRDEQTRIKESVYNMVYLSLFYNNLNINDETINELLIYEMCNLHKLMIDNGDSEGLKTLYFKNLHYKVKDIKNSLIFVITILYLYYLSIREELVAGSKLQEYANMIINDSHNEIKNFYCYIDILQIAKNYITIIQKLMYNWEFMNENEMKSIIMNYVIDDFFIFMSLDKLWRHDRLYNIVDTLFHSSIFQLYNRYFSTDNGIVIKNKYVEFHKIFIGDKPNLLDEKIDILHNVFNKKYKNETIKLSEKEKISDQQKIDFKKLIINKIQQVNDELKIFDFRDTKSTDSISRKNNIIIYNRILSNSFFQYNDLEPVIANSIYTEIITSFIRSFYNNIEYQKISYRNKDKQKTLVDMIEKLKITPTVSIGNRDEFWEEEEPDILSKYTSNMHQIKYPGGYNYYFILDHNLIEFSMENIRVEYVELTWDDIKQKCQETDKGELSFNVTDNIYIPFEKSEVEQYITNIRKKILVYADINLRLKEKKVGAGIEIISK